MGGIHGEIGNFDFKDDVPAYSPTEPLVKVFTKADYRIKHISNPFRQGGGVVTDDIDFVSGWYENKINDVGQAELTLRNGWIKVGNGTKLARILFDKYDIIEIWRNETLRFSGVVLSVSITLETVIVQIASQAHLLTTQYSEKDEYLEEPSQTVKRLLKGWYFYFSDDFNRAALGSGWNVISGGVSIEGNRLKMTGDGTSPPVVQMASGFVDWTRDLDIKFDLVSKGTQFPIILRPNGFGAATQFTPYPSGVPNWQNVDEVISDEDSTYNYCSLDNRRDLYAMEDPNLQAGTRIHSVTISARARRSGGGSVHFRILGRIGGVEFASPKLPRLSTTYQDYSYTWTLNPVTGLPWTVSDVTSLQAGALALLEGGTLFVTQVWVAVDARIPFNVYFPYVDSNYYIRLGFQNSASESTVLERNTAGTPPWKEVYNQTIPGDAHIRIKRIDNRIIVTANGVTIFDRVDPGWMYNYTGYLRFAGVLTATSPVTAYIDNVSLRLRRQLLAEGRIEDYGSSILTQGSRETLLGMIDKQLCAQLYSPDPLAKRWEWRDVPVAHDPANPQNPHGALDFRPRIGENKNILLSIDKKNLVSARTKFDFETFRNSVIGLGAGTSDVDHVGQLEYVATDAAAYDEVGMIVEILQQYTSVGDMEILKRMTELSLGKYSVHENLQVDPIEYDRAGYQVGDGYIIDVPELLTDKTAYYRIISEKREFGRSGQEKIILNWKDSRLGLIGLLKDIRREILSKVRFNQGSYVSQSYIRRVETVSAGSRTANNAKLYFYEDVYAGVRQAFFCFESTGATNKVYIDNVDRTAELFGSATVGSGTQKANITSYIASLGEHTIEYHNGASTSASMAVYGDVILYRR